MSTRLDPGPLPVDVDGAPAASSVELLDAGVRSLAALVEALRQRSAGQPAEFFTGWTRWRAAWEAFAARRASEPEQPMSAEDRAQLRRYVEQYESIRQGVLRSLAPPALTPGVRRDTDGGWPWWAWALLLGGGAAVALHAAKVRSST